MNDDKTFTEYVLYARKSSETEDRQVLSIDSQVSELQALGERGGFIIADVRREAHSAKLPGRPVFNTLMDDIEAGRVHGIVVWNADRLSRNSMDTGRLIYLFDLGKLREIVTPSQTFRNTPNDKFLLNLLCSQAKLENDNKGINVKRGLKAKAERGIYPAPAPLGYLNDRYAERGNKTIVKDPERYEAVRRMFDLMLSGIHTPAQIRRIAVEKWGFKGPYGKPMPTSAIYNLFTRPFYYGMFEYPVGSGNWYKGVHEAMITEDEYDRIQVMLGRKARPRPKTHQFAFTGMIRCGECGLMVTAETKTKHQQNGNVHSYTYYRCTKKKDVPCSQKYLEEKKLKKQILAEIAKVEIPPEFHEWAVKWYREQNRKDAAFAGKVNDTLASERKSCLDKIDNLIDMRAAREISAEEFLRRKGGLLKEKARLDELLIDAGNTAEKRLERAVQYFDFARDARRTFVDGGLDARKKVLADLGSNLVLKDRKLSISIEKPLRALESSAKEARAIHARLGPRKHQLVQPDFESVYSQNPTLLGGLESNQNSQLQRLLSYH